jgi:prepilin-type N-terminal cleavage/methylation domain-containing protein
MNRRRGYSLIEMLVVMATTAAMLGIALGLLHLLIRLEHGSREEVRQRTTLHRLADRFRRDVHAARQFPALEVPRPPGAQGPEREEGTSGWRFSLDDGRAVQYRAEQGQLVRAERAEGDVIAQDSYVLPPHATASIALVGDEAPGIVRLRIVPEPTPSDATWSATCIDAELGKDRRFLERQEPDGAEP